MRSLFVLLVFVAFTIRARPAGAEPGDKDPATATLLAVGATVAGVLVVTASAEQESLGGVFAGGALFAVGPSAGHLYTGHIDRAIAMSALRAGALGIQVIGAKLVAEGLFEDSRDGERDGLLLILAGVAIYTAAATADLKDAPRSARRYNARQRALAVAPGMIRTPLGASVPMLALGGQF